VGHAPQQATGYQNCCAPPSQKADVNKDDFDTFIDRLANFLRIVKYKSSFDMCVPMLRPTGRAQQGTRHFSRL
jgi:hypothetical protein